jgi:hypothetical protein
VTDGAHPHPAVLPVTATEDEFRLFQLPIASLSDVDARRRSSPSLVLQASTPVSHWAGDGLRAGRCGVEGPADGPDVRRAFTPDIRCLLGKRKSGSRVMLTAFRLMDSPAGRPAASIEQNWYQDSGCAIPLSLVPRPAFLSFLIRSPRSRSIDYLLC